MSEQTCSVCGRVSSHGDIGLMFDSVVCYAAVDCEAHLRLIRALTAQAWAVAVAYAWSAYYGETTDVRWVHGTRTQFDGLVSMPAPADLAREILGDE